MFTIQVVRRSTGKPEKDKKVCCSGRYGLTKDIWTDHNGEAHFDGSPFTGKVFVNGNIAYEGEIAGRVVVYV